MSVLIKGMEMPPSCFLCKLSFMSGERLFCSAMKNEEVLRSKIDSNCPLIEVPPHGRLIDADALIAAGWQLSRDNIFTGKFEAALLSSVPTIVEAEEGE